MGPGRTSRAWYFHSPGLCYDVLSVPCSPVITCWEGANLFALLNELFLCASLFTFPFGILGQVWFLIVLILDLCQFLYFVSFLVWQYSREWNDLILQSYKN